MAERYWMLVGGTPKSATQHAFRRQGYYDPLAVCGTRIYPETYDYVTCKRCIKALDKIKAAQGKEAADA